MSRPKAVAILGGLDELRQRVTAGHSDFAIMVAGGLGISRKTIRLVGGRRTWNVRNHVDGSVQLLTDLTLWDESNIGEALDKGALLDMDGDDGLIRVAVEGRETGTLHNAAEYLASRRSQLPAGQDGLPDAPLTDWYAGARLKPTKATVHSTRGWEAGDAIVSFSDIGWSEASRTSHGQLVVYVVDHTDGRTYACSAEIDPEDAITIGKFLTKWGKAERRPSDG